MKVSLSHLWLGLAILSLLVGCNQGSTPDGTTVSAPIGASATVEKIKFHQKGGTLTYELTVVDGNVTAGMQHFGNPREAVAKVVGGWFDNDRGTLCVLIQGTKVLDEKWRSQAQHFRIDRNQKSVTLEHALYDYGQVLDPTMMTEHVLDQLEVSSSHAR